MEKLSNQINCPNCGYAIDVNTILYQQLNEQIKKEYNARLAEQKNEYDKKYTVLNSEKEKIEVEKRKITEQIDKGVTEKLKTERQRIEEQLRQQIMDEQSEQLSALEKELNQKSDQLKEFNKAKAEIEKLKREKDELKDEIEADAEKRLNEKILEEKEKIRKAVEDKMELKISESNNVIEQLREQLKIAQRKAEQGSGQLKGEVQELAIEEYLRKQFPLDTIDEIKKGVRGADCLQIINTETKQNCGSIYYESKRTKDFQKSWIEKFKNDMREKGANIGVLITDAMPSDMDRMGQKEGIWICTYNEFKGLCIVLRDSIIQISNALSTQENKGDKMTMLYDFLTSNEFRLQVEAIVEGFTQMKNDLETEKRSIQGLWKRREKQIQKVRLNATYMHNSIRGIAGSAIQPIKALELPEFEEDIED